MRMANEFTFMGRTVQVVERENALHARFAAYIDGVPTGVNFHLASSAEADAKREIERQDAERKRVTQPQWQLPPSDEDFAAADEQENHDRHDLCC